MLKRPENDRLCLINTKFLMLHDGQAIFDGPDEQLWESTDPILRKFLTDEGDLEIRE